jgi:hypothetical protein
MFGKKIKRKATRAGPLPGDSFLAACKRHAALKLLRYTKFGQALWLRGIAQERNGPKHALFAA